MVTSRFFFFSWWQKRYISLKHNGDKVLVFERMQDDRDQALLFAFNFHPTKSFPDYRIGAPFAGDWEVVLDSEREEFGGLDRLDPAVTLPATEDPWCDRPASLHIYLPSHSVSVLRMVRRR